ERAIGIDIDFRGERRRVFAQHAAGQVFVVTAGEQAELDLAGVTEFLQQTGRLVVSVRVPLAFFLVDPSVDADFDAYNVSLFAESVIVFTRVFRAALQTAVGLDVAVTAQSRVEITQPPTF